MVGLDLDLRWLFVGCVAALTIGCQNPGHDGDSSGDDGCYDVPVGAGAEANAGAPADCCGAQCCGGYCGEGDGYFCTTDEECGAGMVCDGGACMPLPADVLPPCEAPPVRAELAFGAGTNNAPGALALMDEDGDGAASLVIARGDGTVSIWTDAGLGSFEEEGPFTSGSFGLPRALEVTDFDEDGVSDFALVGDGSPGQLLQILGDEMGMYTPQPPIAAGARPTEMEVQDFNGDGVADVALLSTGLPDVAVVHMLYADGAGGSLVPVDIPLSFPPLHFVSADVDDDGRLDLVVAHPDGVGLYSATGSGGYAELALLSATPGATVAAVAVSGDRIVRVAATPTGGEVALWDWAGDPTNTAPTQRFDVTEGLGTVVLADFDGDGSDDIVAATGTLEPDTGTAVPGNLHVLLFEGATPTCATSYPLSRPTIDLVGGDLNGDGLLDVAAASGVDTLSVLLSD